MGMFDNLEVEKDITVETEDKIGGGGFAKVDHTGFYDMEIVKAYAGVSQPSDWSKGGAYNVTIEMKSSEGAFFTLTEYITSGTEKGCKNYYIKDGVKNYLPGYSKIKALDSLLGNDRDYPATEKKNLMIWDYDQSKELPVEKEAITSWFGKRVGVLITKKLEDKFSNKTESVAKYEVQHFLDPVTGQTRNEKTAGVSGFKDKWLVANPADKVIDKRKESKNSGGGSDTSTPDDSPFGNEEDPFPTA